MKYPYVVFMDCDYLFTIVDSSLPEIDEIMCPGCNIYFIIKNRHLIFHAHERNWVVCDMADIGFMISNNESIGPGKNLITQHQYDRIAGFVNDTNKARLL